MDKLGPCTSYEHFTCKYKRCDIKFDKNTVNWISFYLKSERMMALDQILGWKHMMKTAGVDCIEMHKSRMPLTELMLLQMTVVVSNGNFYHIYTGNKSIWEFDPKLSGWLIFKAQNMTKKCIIR